VLNSELPIKIRSHTVSEFNRGTYDIIIASDERVIAKSTEKSNEKNNKKDASIVSRGIDFQFVSNIINFDFPLDINTYIHRAGRTARGNNQGNVLSFVSVAENNLVVLVEEYLKASYPSEHSDIIKNHQFKLEEVEPFKYRANDAWFAVTKSAVREARLKEIKKEMYNSEKLKTFFDNSPRELHVIRHDAPLNIIKPQEHLAEVPDYIVPAQLKNIVGIVTRKRKNHTNISKTKQKYENRSKDALSFESLDFGKKKRKF
jgi:ATP-dependent RNA helicase DDX56/DBP9